MDNDQLKVTETEGVEAPVAEPVKSSIRKSSRLQSKKSLPPCSKYVLKSYHSNSKYTKKPSKASHRNEINGVFSANTASVKFSTVVPSFEYHVQAKKGISLIVDLNMKRSDWVKSMEKAVCVCHNHSGSFRKEVERLRDRNNNLKVSSPDKTFASDASMSSCVENKVSAKSMDGENEVITVSGSKQCWSKVDLDSELVIESFENSEEVQLSDFSSPQKGSFCSRTDKMCSESLLNSNNEVNQETGGNLEQLTVRNEERINSSERMEVSGREENAFVGSASDEGPKRKKRCYKSDHISGQSHERILRSTPIYGGKILERDGVNVWRSSRLHY